MYTYIMSHRTQITLTDSQYRQLKHESEKTGLGLAEIIRRALSNKFGTFAQRDTKALEESFGAWADRDFDGEAYVEKIRPGLGRRMGL